MRFLRSIPPQGRWIFILPAVTVACCASASVFYVLAAYGAYATILSFVRRAMLRGGSSDPPGGGPDGND